MPYNCCERTLNMAGSSSFRIVLSKKDHSSDGSRFNQVVLLLLVLKKKIKMETQNIMVSSYPLKVSSTQSKVVPLSSC